MGIARHIRVAACGLLFLAALTGCEDPPPRNQIVVDSAAADADAEPGDGVCATAGGECTLRAAVEEANLGGPTDVLVPAVTMYGGALTITGDVAIVGAGVDATHLNGMIITVAAGARGIIRDIGATDIVAGSRLVVAGHANVERSVLYGSSPPPLEVLAGGSVVVANTYMLGFGSNGAVVHGVAAFLHTTVHGAEANPLVVGPTGVAHSLATTYGYTEIFVPSSPDCVGQPIVSHGYNVAESATCAPGPLDIIGQGNVEGLWGGSFGENSPRVDAIPLGAPACPGDTVDIYGNLRGVDGNGDGIPGCDSGPVERQPDDAL